LKALGLKTQNWVRPPNWPVSIKEEPMEIPEFSLVVLVGASGSGKSTLAQRLFLPTEVISSDTCRGWVADNENDQSATEDAFDILYTIAEKRLAAKRLTVLDATHVQPDSRTRALALARQYHCLPVAIVLDMPEEVCHARNAQRPDRAFGPQVVRSHRRMLRQTLKRLREEGFRKIEVLRTPEQAAALTITRVRLWNDRRDETGPFDLIGDVHGCGDELELLLAQLGYQPFSSPEGPCWQHPEGRKVVFLGDLVDRGPRSIDSLLLARSMVLAGTALCVPGNHEAKFLRYLQGKKVQLKHGLENTVAELEALPPERQATVRQQLSTFIEGLVSHLVLDQGRLVAAHAGMRADMQGRASGAVRQFALYGDTTGEIDEFGLPVRHNWAREYDGKALVVYGHTPIPDPMWLNHTVNIDTGCVFGGRLSALRYPEKEIVSVPAAQVYREPIRPLQPPPEDRLLLDLRDVTGTLHLSTRLGFNVVIRPEQSSATLEAMSRFGGDPRWLIYLPPTMSPCETSQREGYLEHPEEALGYYAKMGLTEVICQRKHMGSRALVVLTRSPEVAAERFDVQDGSIGLCYTRTGRPFFNDAHLHRAFLERIQQAMEKSGLWETMKSDWVLLDGELMPWSAKAQSLLQTQYAAVGSAARGALSSVNRVLAQAQTRIDMGTLPAQFARHQALADQFTHAYRQYCWPVNGLADYRYAPFHLLAAEGQVFSDRSHLWHMEQLGKLCAADPELLLATEWRQVALQDPVAVQSASDWWLNDTANGGEGMVVKPLDFYVKQDNKLLQPAIKCRGREYLRIIYGMTYDQPGQLERLRKRNVNGKRYLAQREFALGLEALQLFVERAPLRSVHSHVFGVLAMETEVIDPRL
jgi:protein phosphatase